MPYLSALEVCSRRGAIQFYVKGNFNFIRLNVLATKRDGADGRSTVHCVKHVVVGRAASHPS